MAGICRHAAGRQRSLRQIDEAQTPLPILEPVFPPGNGVSIPVVVNTVNVQYSYAAMKKKVKGTILLGCVVTKDGTTRDVELMEALEEKMDADAIAALEKWTFKPGLRGGEPVAVRATVRFAFTMK